MKQQRVVIYARVSTASQDYDRQLSELRLYASTHNCEVVKVFAEKISGAKKIEEREGLNELLNYVAINRIDKVLIYECSRLSRRVVDFLTVVEHLSSLGISIHILQNGLDTLLPNKQPNPIAQLVIGILAQFNSMERSLIRARMQSGYNHYRQNGGKVGRKTGYRKDYAKFAEEYAEEIKLLKKGISMRNIARLTGTSTTTLQKVKKLI